MPLHFLCVALHGEKEWLSKVGEAHGVRPWNESTPTTCYDDMLCMTGKTCYEYQEKPTKVRKRQARNDDMVAYSGLLAGLYVELGR